MTVQPNNSVELTSNEVVAGRLSSRYPQKYGGKKESYRHYSFSGWILQLIMVWF